MKKADIEIGKSYRTDRDWPLYGAKVRVLEKDVPRPHGRQRGIRVVVERAVSGGYFKATVNSEHVILSRQLLAPWTDADDAAADERDRVSALVAALRTRVRGLEGVEVTYRGLLIDLELATAFLDRMGVPQ